MSAFLAVSFLPCRQYSGNYNEMYNTSRYINLLHWTDLWCGSGIIWAVTDPHPGVRLTAYRFGPKYKRHGARSRSSKIKRIRIKVMEFFNLPTFRECSSAAAASRLLVSPYSRNANPLLGQKKHFWITGRIEWMNSGNVLGNNQCCGTKIIYFRLRHHLCHLFWLRLLLLSYIATNRSTIRNMS